MNGLFKLLLTFNSTAFIWVVFGFKHIESLPSFFGLGKIIWPIAFTASPILLAKISILLMPKRESDEINSRNIKTIEHIDNSYLPSYLGYFFVALSANNFHITLYIYCLITIFSHASQVTYFNPVLLILGYKFYRIETQKGSVIHFISHEKYKNPNNLGVVLAHRINDHTFITPK